MQAIRIFQKILTISSNGPKYPLWLKQSLYLLLTHIFFVSPSLYSIVNHKLILMQSFTQSLILYSISLVLYNIQWKFPVRILNKI